MPQGLVWASQHGLQSPIMTVMAISLPTTTDVGAPTMQQRLVVLRWWFLLAELLVIVLVPTLADLRLPQLPMLAVLALQAAANGWARWCLRATPARGDRDRDVFSQLVIDITALAVLMFLSGGAANPVISLLLPPVAIAALVLPGRLVAVIAGLAVIAYSILMQVYLPLPIADVARATRLHLLGMWFTFVVSVAMMAWFIVRMTGIVRAREAELAAIREQALRDERVLALGMLAAGAAHELSTPLATMAIIVGELEAEEGLANSLRADVALLRQQIGACKGIISGMAERAGVGRADSIQALRADHWLQALFDRWQLLRPQVRAGLDILGPSPAPPIVAETMLDQGLLNLFNNGADAGTDVRVLADWTDQLLIVEVRDNGRGFAEDILLLAGKSPLPAHAKGSGIGLFLAKAAIERMGGRLSLANDGGGVARVELPRYKG